MIHEYIERETPYCIAVFNSRVAKHYEWYKTLREREVTVLHLIDHHFTWYHGCIDETRELLDKYKPARLVGASMGGYAALLFGALHGIEVKAFGPQTTLTCPWDDRWTPEWAEIRKKTKYPEYLDLKHLKLRPKADIYYCEGVELDFLHARRMKGCVLKRCGCAHHSDEVKGIRPAEIFDI